MNDLFDFDTQLEIGNNGESDFQRYYRALGPVKSLDRSIDFILKDGQTVELKTDTYDMRNTPNFFMEMFGDIVESKIGGPWRAMQDDVDFFVYYFPKNRTFFWFRTSTLCKHLDSIIARGQLNPKEIRNKGWSARGYAIPRQDLVSVIYKQDIF